jgi:hypothetical protein
VSLAPAPIKFGSKMDLGRMGFDEVQCFDCREIVGIYTCRDMGNGKFLCLQCDFEWYDAPGRGSLTQEEEDAARLPRRARKPIPSWDPEEESEEELRKEFKREPPSWFPKE